MNLKKRFNFLVGIFTFALLLNLPGVVFGMEEAAWLEMAKSTTQEFAKAAQEFAKAAQESADSVQNLGLLAAQDAAWYAQDAAQKAQDAAQQAQKQSGIANDASLLMTARDAAKKAQDFATQAAKLAGDAKKFAEQAQNAALEAQAAREEEERRAREAKQAKGIAEISLVLKGLKEIAEFPFKTLKLSKFIFYGTNNGTYQDAINLQDIIRPAPACPAGIEPADWTSGWQSKYDTKKHFINNVKKASLQAFFTFLNGLPSPLIDPSLPNLPLIVAKPTVPVLPYGHPDPRADHLNDANNPFNPTNYPVIKALTIEHANALTNAQIVSYLPIACALDLLLPIKQGLAAVYANKILGGDIDQATPNDDLPQVKSLIRYEYLKVKKEDFAQGEIFAGIEIDENFEIVRQLIQEHILPGITAELQENNLVEYFSNIFHTYEKLMKSQPGVMSAVRKAWFRIGSEADMATKWFNFLPQDPSTNNATRNNLQNNVKIDFLKSGGDPSLIKFDDSLGTSGWGNLTMEPDYLIPPITKYPNNHPVAALRNHINLFATAAYYIQNHLSEFVSGNKPTAKLKTLPERFQNIFKACYHCVMLANERPLWLDKKEVTIYTSHLNATGLLLPDWQILNIGAGTAFEGEPSVILGRPTLIDGMTKAELLNHGLPRPSFFQAILMQLSLKLLRDEVLPKLTEAFHIFAGDGSVILALAQEQIDAEFVAANTVSVTDVNTFEKVSALSSDKLIPILNAYLKIKIPNDADPIVYPYVNKHHTADIADVDVPLNKLRLICFDLYNNYVLKQIMAKIEWAHAGIPPTDPLNSLASEREWTLLADHNRIPELTGGFAGGYNAIAERMVTQIMPLDGRIAHLKSAGKKLVSAIRHPLKKNFVLANEFNVAPVWLKSLPEDFYKEIAIKYHEQIKTKSGGGKDVYLDDDSKIFTTEEAAQRASYEGVLQADIDKFPLAERSSPNTVKILQWISDHNVVPVRNPLTTLDETGWTLLAEKNRVPKVIPSFKEQTYRQIAKYYIVHRLTDKFIQKKDAKLSSTDTLKALPLDFQTEFKRYFRCDCLRLGKDVWLDSAIYVPVDYMAEDEFALTKSGLVPNVWQNFTETRSYQEIVTELERLSEEDLKKAMETIPNPNQILLFIQASPAYHNITTPDFKTLVNTTEYDNKAIKKLAPATLAAISNKVIPNFDFASLRDNGKPLGVQELQEIIHEILKSQVKSLIAQLVIAYFDSLDTPKSTTLRKYFIQKLVELNQIPEKIRLAKTGKKPSQAFKKLSSEEWKYLAKNKKIAKLSQYTNPREIARDYVDLHFKYIQLVRGVSKETRLFDEGTDKPTVLLTILPEQFQKDVQRFYSCAMRNRGTPEKLLAGSKDLDIPISYLVETGILDAPRLGANNRPLTVAEIIGMETDSKNQDKLNEFYAGEFPKLVGEAANKDLPAPVGEAFTKKIEDNLQKFFKKLPNNFLVNVSSTYMASTAATKGLKEDKAFVMSSLKKYMPTFNLTFKQYLKNEANMIRLQSQIDTNNELNLTNIPITEIEKTDFDRFRLGSAAIIRKLTISNTSLKDLKAATLTALSALTEVTISNNQELETLEARLFANMNIKTIIIKNNPKLLPNEELLAAIPLTNKIQLLDLGGNNLTNEKVPSLKRISATTLNLSNNEITNLANKIDSTSKFKELNLKNNKFDDLGVASLKQVDLPSLEYIDLSTNKITKLSSILGINFTNLSHLILSQNLISKTEAELPPTVTSTPSPAIASTTFASFGLQPSPSTPTFSKLVTLDLSLNKISSIDGPLLDKFPDKTPSIDKPFLGKFPDKTPSIDKPFLGKFPNLQYLNLHGNSISRIADNAFAGLEKLQALYLGQNKLTTLSQDKLPKISFLDKLINLKTLCLEGNEITTINPFTETLKNLEELYLFGNQIKELNDISVFKNLEQLKVLDLSFNQLSELNRFTFVQQIKLSATAQALQKINVSENIIKTIGKDAFNGLDNSLEYLNLENNGITEIKLWGTNGIPRSCTVKFKGNNATRTLNPFNSFYETRGFEKEWYNTNYATLIPFINPIARGLRKVGKTIYNRIKGIPSGNYYYFPNENDWIGFGDQKVITAGHPQPISLNNIEIFYKKTVPNKYAIAFKDKKGVVTKGGKPITPELARRF